MGEAICFVIREAQLETEFESTAEFYRLEEANAMHAVPEELRHVDAAANRRVTEAREAAAVTENLARHVVENVNTHGQESRSSRQRRKWSCLPRPRLRRPGTRPWGCASSVKSSWWLKGFASKLMPERPPGDPRQKGSRRSGCGVRQRRDA